jgi:predicted SprT family Zn-dependent metalloprotease
MQVTTTIVQKNRYFYFCEITGQSYIIIKRFSERDTTKFLCVSHQGKDQKVTKYNKDIQWIC